MKQELRVDLIDHEAVKLIVFGSMENICKGKLKKVHRESIG